VIASDSFIEVRDCSIKSANDKNHFDKALDHYIQSKLNALTKHGQTMTYTDQMDAKARLDIDK
jgi:hypothetical protein